MAIWSCQRPPFSKPDITQICTAAERYHGWEYEAAKDPQSSEPGVGQTIAVAYVMRILPPPLPLPTPKRRFNFRLPGSANFIIPQIYSGHKVTCVRRRTSDLYLKVVNRAGDSEESVTVTKWSTEQVTVKNNKRWQSDQQKVTVKNQ